MSQRVTWRCDGCRKEEEGGGAYPPPDGWRLHYSQESPGRPQHACSAGCMVLVLHADASALAAAEGVRKAAAEEHAAAAEKARVDGLRRAEAATAEAERRTEELGSGS